MHILKPPIQTSRTPNPDETTKIPTNKRSSKCDYLIPSRTITNYDSIVPAIDSKENQAPIPNEIKGEKPTNALRFHFPLFLHRRRPLASSLSFLLGSSALVLSTASRR